MTPHYAITVVWSEEDAAWVADAPDLRFCSAHADTPEEAVRELRVAMEAWLAEAQSGGARRRKRGTDPYRRPLNSAKDNERRF